MSEAQLSIRISEKSNLAHYSVSGVVLEESLLDSAAQDMFEVNGVQSAEVVHIDQKITLGFESVRVERTVREQLVECLAIRGIAFAAPPFVEFAMDDLSTDGKKETEYVAASFYPTSGRKFEKVWKLVSEHYGVAYATPGDIYRKRWGRRYRPIHAICLSGSEDQILQEVSDLR